MSQPNAMTARLPLRVSVQNDSHEAIAGAEIEVRLEPEEEQGAYATTDTTGLAVIDLPAPPPYVGLIFVSAHGYSGRSLLEPSFQNGVRLEGTELRCDVLLRKSGSTDALVTDQDFAPIPGCPVVLQFQGEPTTRGTDGRLLPGRPTLEWTRHTDSRGHAFLEGLEPGTWIARCERWRDRDSSEAVSIVASPEQPTPVKLSPHTLPLDAYASGRIRVSGGEPDSELPGTVSGYTIDGGRHGRAEELLFDGGLFYVYGNSGESFELRLVDETTGRKCASFTVIVGRHDYDIVPVWGK